VVRDGAVLGVADRALLERFCSADGADKRSAHLADVFGQTAPAYALPSETCRLVATRLAVHNLERLPVVADRKTMRLVAIVSRSDLVKPSLSHFEEEHKRERFRRLAPSLGKRRLAPARKTG
jgi:CBS domain-containing protein